MSDQKATPSDLPVFVTEDNRARLMAIYDDALSGWPVPYEASFVGRATEEPTSLAAAIRARRRW